MFITLGSVAGGFDHEQDDDSNQSAQYAQLAAYSSQREAQYRETVQLEAEVTDLWNRGNQGNQE